MGYKRYERYKDSGVEWIGEIPEHWEVIRLKWLLKSLESGKREIDEQNDFDNEVLSIGGEHIGWQGELILNNCRYISFEFYSKLRQGGIAEKDILLVKDGATIGKCAFVSNNFPFPAAVNEHVFILRTLQNINPKFVFYLIQSDIGQKQIVLQIRGAAQPGLSSDFRKNIIFPLPFLEEQTTIANFLDQKTAEIDNLIADKEKLIQLLQEKRQAIITEAVTKGLDPNVPMKDSGVEWIGKIPAHWEVNRIKYLATVNPNKSEVRYLSSEQEVTFIPMEKIIATGKVDYSLTNTIENLINSYTYFRDGDIIMAKVTPCFENGNIAIVNGLLNSIGFGTTELHVLRCNNKCYNKFLFYYLQSNIFKSKGISEMYGVAGLKRIPTDFILNYKLGIPNYQEQIQIALYLDNTTAKIDTLISDIQTQIDKLREYRESIISEAVTGKIKVL